MGRREAGGNHMLSAIQHTHCVCVLCNCSPRWLLAPRYVNPMAWIGYAVSDNQLGSSTTRASGRGGAGRAGGAAPRTRAPPHPRTYTCLHPCRLPPAVVYTSYNTETSVRALLDSVYGYTSSTAWLCLPIVSAFVILFRVLAAASVKHINYQVR